MEQAARHITLGEIFSEQELAQAAAIVSAYKGAHWKSLVEHLREEIIEPLMTHINQVTGQENDPGYWAWMLVYALRGGSK